MEVMEEEREVCTCCSSSSSSSSRRSSRAGSSLYGDLIREREIQELSVRKALEVLPAANEPQWRQEIRNQMESELERRVRDALATPPRERLKRRRQLAEDRSVSGAVHFLFRDELSKSDQDKFPGVFGLENFSEGIKNIRDDYTNTIQRLGGAAAKPKARHFYTKEGFLKALKSGALPTGVQLVDEEAGMYVDKYGVVRTNDGPFWPIECVPVFPAPKLKVGRCVELEPLYTHLPGMFEYELVLQTDVYTRRHTQWYFFRVHNALPGVTYKFKIINLLKPDSLYNHGMRPLIYSERSALESGVGWIRCGHHISYVKNITNLNCPLLSRCVHYYMLEWQMEFPNHDDTYYLAHCYPYTFTDLRNDLDMVLNNTERKACVRREVLCESRAGNSCFLLTVTNFEENGPKKAVVVTARVHPGETQASWMMKGLVDFITGPDPIAKELRDKFVFKLVPMLNPDGVIVGNYRCSLAGRDLNRNYRHPRRDNFPTIFAVKAMVEELAQKQEVVLYCDLHGHSRRHNVFMYGNNTSSEDDTTAEGGARSFVSERLFPWLMASTCPDKFSFAGCKFHIQRCKESTGRVVMWRQMNIFNSFTLEATFSGSILDKQNCRHFNIHDLMDVGRSLAKTVLEYHHLQEDKMKQVETVLELTQTITRQFLQARGLVGTNSSRHAAAATTTTTAAAATTSTINRAAGLQNAARLSSSLPNLAMDKGCMEAHFEVVKEAAQKHTGDMVALATQPDPSNPDLATDKSPDLERGQGRKEEKAARGLAAEGHMTYSLTPEEAKQFLESPSFDTVEGCFSVLAAFNLRDVMEESDSSDSDSESEPEMKPPDRKPRKKKRKTRKQRDQHHHNHHHHHHHRKHANCEKRHEEKEKTKVLTSASNTLMDRLNKERKSSSHFQSKYIGRHNNGVPCFTEERSVERAAKKVVDRRRKPDDEREFSFMSFEDQGGYVPPYPTHLFPITPQQDDLSPRLRGGLAEGGVGMTYPSKTLLGTNGSVRTGYTHADSVPENHPVTKGSRIFHPSNLLSTLHFNDNDDMNDGSSSARSHLSSVFHQQHLHQQHHHHQQRSQQDQQQLASNRPLPPIEDGADNRTMAPSQARRLTRRHSSPTSSSARHMDRLRLHDNQGATSTQVKALATDRRPQDKPRPGHAPLIRKLQHPDIR